MKKQLAQLLQDRVNLSEENALQAADVALEFVKGKLPENLAPHFTALMAGEDAASAVKSALGGGLGGALGGMFGGNK